MFSVAQAIAHIKARTRNGDGIIRSTAYYAVEDDVEEEPLLFFSSGLGLQEIPLRDEQWISELSIDAEDERIVVQFYGGVVTFLFVEERPEATVTVTPPEDDYDEVIEIDAD